MTAYEGLRPFLEFSKFFGHCAYTLTGYDVSLSRKNIIYSGFCTAIYSYLIFIRFEAVLRANVDKKLRFLTIVRTSLLAVVILVDVLICLVWHRKLKASLVYMNRYDRAVKLKQEPKVYSIGSWIGLIGMVIYFLYLGWLTYIYEEQDPFASAIIYIVMYTSMTSGILKFAAIIASLLRRFRHLNGMIKNGIWEDQIIMGFSRRQLNLRDTWCLHACLLSAAEEINCIYTFQLLFWISGLTFNIVSRIYVICDTDDFSSYVRLLRDGGLAIGFSFLLAMLTGICHMTALEANKIGSSTFSPNSCVFRRRCDLSNLHFEESFQIGMYFLFHRFHFTAGFGLVQVDLPLLQSIVGAMTTYLVILKSP